MTTRLNDFSVCYLLFSFLEKVEKVPVERDELSCSFCSASCLIGTARLKLGNGLCLLAGTLPVKEVNAQLEQPRDAIADARDRDGRIRGMRKIRMRHHLEFIRHAHSRGCNTASGIGNEIVVGYDEAVGAILAGQQQPHAVICPVRLRADQLYPPFENS